ncbi:hypothetical protein EC81_020800 [Bacteroides fragilis]|uniref:Transmembrane protein n=2 Tax=Bacteroides fragilis TaxID=817 RepID=A0A413K4J2_BACFG|nr:hypothetical protein BFAG_03275 [Bacteroides fragilis 3_1_12]QCQ38259.1 hypothetical protein IA74_020325 [Bacteroides fragilis]QLK84260.1 hypothetical protein DBK98_020160 [Bacteroides sp. PHL 2737]QCQ46891.1 hypothetical protein EC80_019700 [Bacteroides fragilis]QCQ56028.1 hypothetical protein EC81_020800 [Bacteroides fragilis]
MISSSLCEIIPRIGIPFFLPLVSLTISVIVDCVLLIAFFYTFVYGLKYYFLFLHCDFYFIKN